MKLGKIIIPVLAMASAVLARGDYNPGNPPEPEKPVAKHWVTVERVPQSGGSTSVTRAQYEEGSRLTIHAYPKTSFTFTGWENGSGEVLSTSTSYTFVVPEEDVDLTARFRYTPGNPSEPETPPVYAPVNVTVNPAGSCSVSGTGRYVVGSTVRLNAYTNSSFEFVNFTLGDELLSTSRQFDYVVRESGNDITANCRYNPSNPEDPEQPVKEYRVDYHVDPPGAGYTNPKSSQAPPGEKIFVSAFINRGFKFLSWKDEEGNVVSNSSNLWYVVPERDSELTACYVYSPDNPKDPESDPIKRNIIYGSRRSVSAGEMILYDIMVENVDEVTGMTIDVTMPEGFIADYDHIQNGDRAMEHTISSQEVDSSTRRIFLQGSGPIAGGSGAVLRIPVRVPADAAEGSSYTIRLSRGVLIKSSGEQETIAPTEGVIKISEEEIKVPTGPDFVIRNITAVGGDLMPGDRLEIRWQVANEGNLSAGAGWSENLLLVDASGRRATLGKVYSEVDYLGIGESVSRSAIVTVPELPGVDGSLDVAVELTPYPYSGEPESMQVNNYSRTTDTPVRLGKRLLLEMPESVGEGVDGNIRCRLMRSGDWSRSEEFALRETKSDSRLTFPTAITIPKNQSGVYFQARLGDNDMLDEDTSVEIEVSGNGYQPVTARMEIVDDELPEIELSFGKERMMEGEKGTLHVTLPRPARENLQIALSCDAPLRFTFPQNIVIAAGESESDVEVEATDNESIENLVDVCFRATASKYGVGEVWIELEDNDMPALELEISPEEVSEGAGTRGIRGVVRRLTNKNVRVEVLLSDNNPNILDYEKRIILEKGVEMKDFNIGVIDNSTVDGDRIVDLTAAVFLHACSCSATGESGGAVTRRITVIDNDGPSLSLTPSIPTLTKERGESNLEIRLNMVPGNSLKVALSSEPSGLLEMPESVTFAKGESAATVKVKAAEEAFQGEERMVVVNATAEGFSRGTTLLLISDKRLPDAELTLAIEGEKEVIPGESVALVATVVNRGTAAMPDAMPVDFYVSGSKDKIATLHTSSILQPGEVENLRLEWRAPEIPGSYRLTAHANESGNFPELTLTNNGSNSESLTVRSPFTATLEVDNPDIEFGGEVTLRGVAPNYGKLLEVYYISGGVRNSVTLEPEADGKFTLNLTPAFAGDYECGVCVPGEVKMEPMATFRVSGLEIPNTGYLKFDMEAGREKSQMIRLSNPSSLPVGDIKVSVGEHSDNLSVEVGEVSDLAGGSVDIPVKVTALGVTPGTDWETVELTVSGGRSLKATKRIYYYGRPTSARLMASVSCINTTMTIGEPRLYRFSIWNNGSGTTGDITLSLPGFMQSGTPVTLPAIAPGESEYVDLMLTATSGMQLNLPVKGTIGINCANGTGLAIPFEIEPVSEVTGDLVVDVKDEYTFYSEEAPHVAGADVMITHPVSGRLIASGKTDADGLWRATLPEGYYTIEVSAQKHGSYRNNIQVAPGRETSWPVFLDYQAITYEWRVDETTVDDEYEIVTTVDFETRVPKPVVVVDFPKLEYRNQLAYIRVTNHGLIKATNIEVLTPGNTERVQFNVVGDNLIPELMPGEMRMIPLMVTVDQEGALPDFQMATTSYSFYGDTSNDSSDEGSSASLRAPSGSGSGCVEVPCQVEVDDPECDPLTGEPIYGRKRKVDTTYRTGNCGSPFSIGGGSGWGGGWGGSTGGGTPGGGSGPGTPGNGSGNGEHVSTYWQDRVRTILTTGCMSDCEKALADAIKACYDAVTGCTGPGSLLPDEVECARAVAGSCNPSKIEDAHDSVSCGASAAGCVPGLGCPAGVAECINRAIKAFRECLKLYQHRKDNGDFDRARRESSPENEDEILAAKSRRAETVALYLEYFDLIRRNLINVVGADGWNRITRQELSGMLGYILDHCDGDGYVADPEVAMTGKPVSVDAATFRSFIERYNNSIRYQQTGEKSDNMLDPDEMREIASRASEIRQEVAELGYPDMGAFGEEAVADLRLYSKMAEEPSNGVCSSITLKFKQSMVLTRQAFRGTLSVTNGNEEVAMTDVSLQVKIRDEEGNLAGEREFAVAPETLTGFEGENALGASWKLGGGSTGEVTVLFIPSRYAAPTEPKVYSFGGTLSYVDPFNGMTVSRELSPIDMTVAPSPLLDLDYFMQRDVIGDDPLTVDRVELSEPAEFALLIKNKGFGEASNLRMTTTQPEILENSRGLQIDFRIHSSSLNGEERVMAMGDKIPTEFGNLKGGESACAQWWMMSSLLGHFNSYNVEANQLSAYGSETMSLLDGVRIHELIHGFTPAGGSGKERGFLVNDIDDGDVTPDMLYLSGGDEPCEVSSDVAVSVSDLTEDGCRLDVGAGVGWTYGRIAAPWSGQRKVVGVRRLSDGKELPVDNVWVSSVTMRNGASPVHEDVIHFIADLQGEPESFELLTESLSKNRVKILFVDLPEEGKLSLSPVKQMSIFFSKYVDVSSVGPEDFTLYCQGEPVDLSGMTVGRSYTYPGDNASAEAPQGDISDEDRFSDDIWVDFGEATSRTGYYVLKINTGGILDYEGLYGTEGYQYSWSQLSDGQVGVTFDVQPAGSGKVDKESGRYPYNKEIRVKATPNPGYLFSHWEMDGEYLSDKESVGVTPVRDMTLTAQFVARRYLVTVEWDPERGQVEGSGTGYYTHGSLLTGDAVANSGYEFSQWLDESGNQVSSDPHLELKIEKEWRLEAEFRKKDSSVEGLPESADVRLYPTAVREQIYVSGDFAEIESMRIYDAAGLGCRILKGVTKDSPVNLSTLLPGVYFVRVETDRGSSLHRIVKL